MDNNHLLLLMIHVFRENEEQLLKVKPKKVVKSECLWHNCRSVRLMTLVKQLSDNDTEMPVSLTDPLFFWWGGEIVLTF